jgi:hypothetical protein
LEHLEERCLTFMTPHPILDAGQTIAALMCGTTRALPSPAQAGEGMGRWA